MPEASLAAVRPRAAAAAWLGGVIGELVRICDAVQGDEGHADPGDDFRGDPSQNAGGADEAGVVDEELRQARARRPPVARRTCAKVAGEIAASVQDDFPVQDMGTGDDELENLRDLFIAAAKNPLSL